MNINMAESRNKKFVSRVTENADFIIFAEELVNYVMAINAPLYMLEREQMHIRDHTFNAFAPSVQRAVGFLDKWFNIRDYDMFRQIHRNQIPSPATYTIIADKLAFDYFADGFYTKPFLFFCVRISKMAALYSCHGIMSAPMLAKSYIISNLKMHHMTVDGWNNLHRISRELNNMLRENDRFPNNTNSEENKLNLAQDEVSGHESRNFSLREKQNVLSENEESLVQQQERAYSKSEIYVKKSVQYCSESSSEIGARSLKEPKITSKLSFDKTNDGNYLSTISGGNNFVNKSESNEKLVSETPNVNRMSVSSKRDLDFASNMKNNTNIENVLLTDCEE